MASTIVIGPVDVLILVAYVCAIIVVNWFRKRHLSDDQ